MNTQFRKWAVLLLLLFCSLGLHAQGSAPDCKLDFVLTSASNSSTYDNRSGYCSTWVVSYNSVGFTSTLALTVQHAPLAAGGVAGTWATFGGTVVSGINPNTSVAQGTTRLEGYYPFMRVNLASLTGTGTVTGRLYGYRYVASKVTESSTGSGLTEVATTDIAAGSANGNGTKFQLFTGSTATNDCAKFDANGNIVSAGAACASGTVPTVTVPYINVGGTLYGPVYTFTDPSLPSYSWVNQGTATITSSNGAQILYSPDSAGAVAIHAREITPPAAPYTLTVAMLASQLSVNYYRTGIGFRESGTGKLTTINATVGNLAIDYWTNPTTYSSTPLNISCTWCAGGVVWYRIQNTGSALKYYLSKDSFNYVEIYSTALTSHFTTAPDRIFFFVNPNAATYGVGVTVLSWLVS